MAKSHWLSAGVAGLGRRLSARSGGGRNRFNARGFDAVRAMLADEVRLDLVNRVTLRGVTKVGEYFHRYVEVDDWQLALDVVERRSAILVYDPRQQSSQPVYFMLLAWDGTQVSMIRDYRYVRYVLREADVVEV
jgi:RNA polymerase sigma-70 factor, ECF subfamily